MLNLKGSSFDTKCINAAGQVGNANAHAMAVSNQDLAKNYTVVTFEFSYHYRVFFTN
jgi:hypothetical protein